MIIFMHHHIARMTVSLTFRMGTFLKEVGKQNVVNNATYEPYSWGYV